MSRQQHCQGRRPVLLQVVLALVICISSTSCKKECGSKNPNNNVIDLSEPSLPGPFHDLTSEELRNLRTFLENEPNIRAVKSSEAQINSSYIYMADLFVPPKADVLNHLDNGGPQPPRQARVMMFRGDLDPPVVEEYICGPLPNVENCDLMIFPNRRNPVEFSVRPSNDIEYVAMLDIVAKEMDDQIGHILMESYGTTFTDCVDDVCLVFSPNPYGSGLTGDINARRNWVVGCYDVPFYLLHSLDFAVFYNNDGSDISKWHAEKIWYAGRLYNSTDELIAGYNSGSIPVQRVTKPVHTEDLFSTLHRRGEPQPENPQRPPTLVEPDGKRYSVKNRTVEYMGWTFNFRSSPFSGPALYDVRYQGERIAYELALSEIAVYYSGLFPTSQTMDYVDSGELLGSRSKSLVPGADCPQSATLISNTVLSQYGEEPAVYDAAFCLFEQNNGYPLRRHLSYEIANGAFYGGMLDSALTFRSILTIANYDYIIDFILHQNGAIEARLMSTGYILASTYTDSQKDYGFRIEENIMGPLHHHLASFKVDLDIGGTSNRYETLDLSEETATLATDPSKKYSQVKMTRNLKHTEQEALYRYNFLTLKYHVVHNNNKKTNYDQLKAFRIQMNGMSPNLVAEGQGNEPTTTWARHQLVVTKRKEEEFVSSSNYGMYDSLDPVVNFTTFYADNEDIVDEDLVFWITSGMHHIPHTEDLPVTPTVGNQLSFFLLPYNYFPECPSMVSRDSVYIQHKDHDDPEKGVKLDWYGASGQQCLTPKSTLEKDLQVNPDQILESKRPNPSDF